MTGRPAFLTSPLLEAAGVPHLFTTRHFPGLERGANGGGALRPPAPAAPGGGGGPPALSAPDGRRLAVVHAGWRGTVQSVAQAAVTALTRAGAPPEGLLAAVG